MGGTKLAASTAAVGLGLAVLGGVAGPAPARAGEWYNDYLVSGVPAYITAPTPFSVTVDGPDPVCAMTYRGVTVTAAPWNFLALPDQDARYEDVDVALCDGGSDGAFINTQVPFSFGTSVISVAKGNDVFGGRSLSLVNHMDVGATIVVRDDKGRTVASGRVEAESSLDGYGDGPELTVPVKGVKKTTRYSVTATGDNGVAMSAPLLIAKGWSTMFSSDSAEFAPCSKVTWSYDARKAPKGARTFKRDIVASLKRLADETGLTFVEVAPAGTSRDDGSRAGIRFSWDDLGAHGPSGIGGTDGSVVINTRDDWPLDKFAGFGNRYRSPSGRGWLIVHETMHTMGFGHVDGRTAIMAPVNYGQNRFSAGDLQGLHALYPKDGCRAGR